MESLSSGLTWAQIQEAFAQSAKYDLSLTYRNRRTKLGKRKNGETEEQKVWRLIVQRRNKGVIRTMLRKNLKDAPEDLLDTVASDKHIKLINGLL